MLNAAVFASGEGTNAGNLFKYFQQDSRIKIKLVITSRPDAGVVAKAEQYKKNVQIISREALEQYSERIIEFLKMENVELIILAGFLLKLPESFIRAFPNRIINIHPALLPKYGGRGMYGLRVHQAVLDNRETETGVTVHYVDEEYDHGDVIIQAKCEVKPDDTAASLSARVRQLEFECLPRAIETFLK